MDKICFFFIGPEAGAGVQDLGGELMASSWGAFLELLVDLIRFAFLSILLSKLSREMVIVWFFFRQSEIILHFLLLRVRVCVCMCVCAFGMCWLMNGWTRWIRPMISQMGFFLTREQWVSL